MTPTPKPADPVSVDEALKACDWPSGSSFTFHDESGEHDPCYVVMPGGAMLPLNHHAGEGVDIARAKFIIAACNAALAHAKPDAEGVSVPTEQTAEPISAEGEWLETWLDIRAGRKLSEARLDALREKLHHLWQVEPTAADHAWARANAQEIAKNPLPSDPRLTAAAAPDTTRWTKGVATFSPSTATSATPSSSPQPARVEEINRLRAALEQIRDAERDTHETAGEFSVRLSDIALDVLTASPIEGEDHGGYWPPCPSCGADLNGGLIWQTFKDRGESDEECDRIALMYRATRTSGQWGRAIALYDRDRDRTVAWRCPDCDHEWSRDHA